MASFSRLRSACCVPVTFLASAITADAHLVVEGAGEVVNGALHPFISPSQVMVLLGLGLLLGRRLPFEMGMPVKVFAGASAASLLVTLAGAKGEVYPPLMIIIAMIIAALVAFDRLWQPWVYGAVCALAAGGVGLDSGVEQGTTVEKLKTLAGTWMALVAFVFYIAACASHAEGRKWAVTAIRIAAAWTIAIAVLMLAFFLKKGG